MIITVNDISTKSNTIKYKLNKLSNNKFELTFNSFVDRDFIISNIKQLWGAPTKDYRDFGINFMGETWKVKHLKLYQTVGNEIKSENAINFERVEKLYYEDVEEPRLNYMLGILEEIYHIEKA